MFGMLSANHKSVYKNEVKSFGFHVDVIVILYIILTSINLKMESTLIPQRCSTISSKCFLCILNNDNKM